MTRRSRSCSLQVCWRSAATPRSPRRSGFYWPAWLLLLGLLASSPAFSRAPLRGRAFGLGVIATIGVIVLPASGFWLVFVPAALAYRAAGHATGDAPAVVHGTLARLRPRRTRTARRQRRDGPRCIALVLAAGDPQPCGRAMGRRAAHASRERRTLCRGRGGSARRCGGRAPYREGQTSSGRAGRRRAPARRRRRTAPLIRIRASSVRDKIVAPD